MRKTITGFTIVELLIVIVVIGILAAITVVAFNGVQQRANDSHKLSDVTAIKKSLELFHADNGYYPSSSNVRNATFRRDVLKLPESTVRPPNATSSIEYCWPGSLTTYCYIGHRPTGVSGDCTGLAEQCVAYMITYYLEREPGTQQRMLSAVSRD